MTQYKTFHRLLAAILALLLAIGATPIAVFAQNSWGGTGVAEVQKSSGQGKSTLCAMGNNLVLQSGSGDGLTKAYYASNIGEPVGSPINLAELMGVLGDTNGADMSNTELMSTFDGKFNGDENAFINLDIAIWVQGGSLKNISSGVVSAKANSITVYMSGGVITGDNGSDLAISVNNIYISGGRIEKNVKAYTDFPVYISGSPSIGGSGNGIIVESGQQFYLNGALSGAEVYVVPKADFVDGTVLASGSGYNITESDLAQLHLTGDFAQGKELYLEGNQIKIRVAVPKQEEVVYLDENSVQQTLTEEYIVINSENPLATWTSGWYVVDGKVTIDSRVAVSGAVKLILKNGANLTVNGGIDVSGLANDFVVYAQSAQADVMGSLTATAAQATGDAGIGSSGGQTAGSITINGGNITAVGGVRSEKGWDPIDPEAPEKAYSGAGIGGGENSSCSSIVINGGVINASTKGTNLRNESNSAGIGNGGYNRLDFVSLGIPAGNIIINGGTVNASGIYWGAGIGGGDEAPIESVVITGGVITAVGDSSAGIGNGGAGDGGSIVISGGTINANSDSGCGIGGGYISDIKSITITGGEVTAFSDRSAGIGSGAYNTTAQVIISGGSVTATSNKGDGIGMGYIFRDTPIDFSTGENGTAVIMTSSIGDERSKDDWNGLIFIDYQGKIYGSSYTVNRPVSIPSNMVLTVENGKQLTVPGDIEFDFDGKLQFDMGSRYTGNIPADCQVYYQIQWDTNGDSIIDDFEYVKSGETPSHVEGSKDATADTVYTFVGWLPEVNIATKPSIYTAQFVGSDRTYTVNLPQNSVGYTVVAQGSTQVNYKDSFVFDVNINAGYTATKDFAVKANGVKLVAEADGSFKVTVTDDITIEVEGVADVTAPSNITVSYENNNFREFLNDITFGLFFKDTVSVTISATDEGSGIKSFTYQLGDNPLQTVETTTGSITFLVEPEFKGNIKNVTAADNAGNTSESIDYEYFAVEKQSPVNVTIDTNGYQDGQWTGGDVTLTLSGASATSGIAKYQYSTDGGKTWRDVPAIEKTNATAQSPLNVIKAQLTVSGNSETEYIFRAVSGAGNGSDWTTPVTVKIDNTVPEIVAQGNVDKYLAKDTVKISAITGISGVAKVEVQKDGGTWQDITATYKNGYTVLENGAYIFRVTTGAGTTAVCDITYNKLDATKPVVTIDSKGYHSQSWTNQNVVLSVLNTANNLGKTTFLYKVDDGEWQLYQEAITAAEETAGTRYTFKAISASGVESDEVFIDVKIDKTAPDGDIRAFDTSIKQPVDSTAFELFFNKNIDVTIDAQDNASGIASVQYYCSQNVLTQQQIASISNWKEYSAFVETATDAKQIVYYVKITDCAGNVSYIGSKGITFDLIAPVITGVKNGASYYTTQAVCAFDTNLKSVTLNKVEVDKTFVLQGDIDTTYVIAVADKAGNVTNYTVAMKPIADLALAIGDITIGNVTTADRDSIEAVMAAVQNIDITNASEQEKQKLQAITDNCTALVDTIEKVSAEMKDLIADIDKLSVDTITSESEVIVNDLLSRVNKLLESSNLTQEEVKKMQSVQEKAIHLEQKLEEVAQAGSTENIDKVGDITTDTVTVQDKDDLIAAKEDLQNALDKFGDNYTDDEKAKLEEKLNQINNAITSIEKVETVESTIDDLPKEVQPDNLEAEEVVKQAKEQYDALTEHEKDMVSDNLKQKLEALVNGLTDYRIILGDGSQWTLGQNGAVTMTANGAVEKFVGIEVDGKLVDTANYTVKSGSTIITLNASYLDTLSAGRHMLTIIYTDGETSGEFEILSKLEVTTPETGDCSGAELMYVSLLLITCGLVGATAYTRKRKFGR